LLVLALAAIAAQPAGAGPMAKAGLFYTGDAYGSFANIGDTVIAGKSAVVTFGCQTQAGAHVQNTVASVHSAPVITTGVIDTTGDSSDNGLVMASRFTADVHDANLLDGLITASEVTAVSTTSNDKTGLHVSSAGSNFVDLVVGGVPINVLPPPNTVLDLFVPGLGVVGSVTLNEQIQKIKANSAALTVNMIHVRLTANIPGVAKAGTEIIVAHAKSDLELNKAGSLDGRAYGTQAKVGKVILSGRTAFIALPCGGTGGHVRTNSVASVNLHSIGSTGTVTDTAQGTITGTDAIGETTSTVQTVKLLSADQGQTFLITADLVKADAHASKSDGHLTFSEAGSDFVNLVVDGNPISNVDANTKLTIDGLTIWLNRVLHTPNSIEVRMIEVIVKGSNPFGLDLHTDIQVAVASASAH